MMNALIWNILSVNTQKAFTKLMNMHKKNIFDFVALMEPFQGVSELER